MAVRQNSIGMVICQNGISPKARFLEHFYVRLGTIKRHLRNRAFGKTPHLGFRRTAVWRTIVRRINRGPFILERSQHTWSNVCSLRGHPFRWICNRSTLSVSTLCPLESVCRQPRMFMNDGTIHTWMNDCRVARFFLVQNTKMGKNVPNYQKIYQMAITYFQWP
jgi:hypothetical protein